MAGPQLDLGATYEGRREGRVVTVCVTVTRPKRNVDMTDHQIAAPLATSMDGVLDRGLENLLTHFSLAVRDAADAMRVMFLVDCGLLSALPRPLTYDEATELGHGAVLVWKDDNDSRSVQNHEVSWSYYTTPMSRMADLSAGFR